ncbi:MAG: hypothetical protein ABI045_04065 [Flavobacteriales bacterium]
MEPQTLTRPQERDRKKIEKLGNSKKHTQADKLMRNNKETGQLILEQFQGQFTTLKGNEKNHIITQHHIQP